MVILGFPSTLIDQIAFRLQVLLGENEDPQREMWTTLRRLEEAGLYQGSIGVPCTVREFVTSVITNNYVLHNSLAFQERRWLPATCDDIQDLTSNLLPSDNHLE